MASSGTANLVQQQTSSPRLPRLYSVRNKDLDSAWSMRETALRSYKHLFPSLTNREEKK